MKPKRILKNGSVPVITVWLCNAPPQCIDTVAGVTLQFEVKSIVSDNFGKDKSVISSKGTFLMRTVAKEKI